MFGMGRKAIPLKAVAESMAQVALMPLEAPNAEDLMFKQQAVAEKVNPDRFTLEVIALQTFALTAAINRERLEGRLKLQTQQALVMEFLHAVHRRLVESSAYDLLRLGMDPDDTFELLTKRAERYSEPGWGRGTAADIPRFFAEFCGHADSSVLWQIGWHLGLVRGDLSGDWLKRFKII